jgi:hypothetical protein
MVGEINLDVLLSSMTASLVDGVYVFVTLKDCAVPTTLTPRMMFVEAEGITLIVTKEEAEAASLDYEFPCRMITLEVHSSLEAVGFIARIATELVKAKMGVNPVSGFYHDHLFVPDGRQDDALRILQAIADDISSKD